MYLSYELMEKGKTSKQTRAQILKTAMAY